MPSASFTSDVARLIGIDPPTQRSSTPQKRGHQQKTRPLATSGVQLRWAHRLQAYVPKKAIFKNVARIRKLATNVPRSVPETFDSPPLRRR